MKKLEKFSECNLKKLLKDKYEIPFDPRAFVNSQTNFNLKKA